MHSRRSLVVNVAALVLCSVSVPITAYAAPADPCSLLTPAQVSAVLGVNVAAGKRIASTVCDWTAPGQPMGVTARKVTVTLLDQQRYAFAKMPINDKRITKTRVSGIGDEAIYGTTAGQMATLTVKKGDAYFTVRVSGFPLDQLEAKEKTLATQIVSKL